MIASLPPRRTRKPEGSPLSIYWDGIYLEYTEAESLDHSIGISGTALLVEIARKRCTITTDGNTILSWYEARILDDFGNTHLPATNVIDIGQAPPSELTPIAANSLLIHQSGGAVNFDGVVVASREERGALTVGGKYLVFLLFQDNRDGTVSRVGSPQMQVSTYSYDERADHFTPVVGDGSDRLTVDLVRRSGGSFRALRVAIRQAVAAAKF
jgi:hypothetical protein